MEESDKRRERLRMMRLEAAQAGLSGSDETDAAPPCSLNNPLAETPAAETSPAAPRFGFYTDPMAAFSSERRQNNSTYQNRQGYFVPRNSGGSPRVQFPPSPSGPRNLGMSPPGAHIQNNYSPYPRMHQSGDSYYSPSPMRSPMGNMSPYPMPQAGSPSFNCTRGRGSWSNSSPSPGSGRSGGRGTAYRGNAPARGFYNKSMVDDAWKYLEPVLWKGENVTRRTPNTSNFIEKSPSTKRPRVTDPFGSSGSKQSLAEYLAASFDEAVGDAEAV